MLMQALGTPLPYRDIFTAFLSKIVGWKVEYSYVFTTSSRMIFIGPSA
jgi:hypothetical protein